MGHGGGGADDLFGAGLGVDAADETAVEFEDLDVDVGEKVEAGVAGAEVIERDGEAVAAGTVAMARRRSVSLRDSISEISNMSEVRGKPVHSAACTVRWKQSAAE